MMLKSVRFTCTYSCSTSSEACILLCNSLNSAFTSEHQRILEAPRVLFSPCARGGGGGFTLATSSDVICTTV